MPRNDPPLSPKPESDDSWQEVFYPPELSLAAAITAIAATYGYFLVFAQFGFLKAMAGALGPAHAWLRPVLAAMAAAGIAGSWTMVWAFRGPHVRTWTMAGFGLGAVAAGLSFVAASPLQFVAVGLLTGAGVGLSTVGLAGMLRHEVGGERLGLCLGIGTGLAYACSNLPPVFRGSAHMQAMVGVAAACIGLVSLQGFAQRAPRHTTKGVDYDTAGVATWVALFLVLVALDSAAFHVIQHNPELRQRNWSDGPQLFLNSGVHLVAGVLAGLALDRRRVVLTLVAGAVLLVTASALISHGTSRISLEALMYAAGVSVYSVVLVFYPARSTRPGLAALVYSVAGWIGSAVGIGLAAPLRGIPDDAPWIAGFLLLALLAIRAWRRRAVQK